MVWRIMRACYVRRDGMGLMERGPFLYFFLAIELVPVPLIYPPLVIILDYHFPAVHKYASQQLQRGLRDFLWSLALV